MFQTIDLAASLKSSADYSVIQTWMRIRADKSHHFLMLDQVRRRMDGPDLIATVEAGVAKWKPRIVGVESSGFQLAICQMLKKKGIPVREVRPDRDKLSRALAATPAMEAGRVWFPAVAPGAPILKPSFSHSPTRRTMTRSIVSAWPSAAL